MLSFCLNSLLLLHDFHTFTVKDKKLTLIEFFLKELFLKKIYVETLR